MTATLMHSVYVYEREPRGMPTGRWEHTLERVIKKKKRGSGSGRRKEDRERDKEQAEK